MGTDFKTLKAVSVDDEEINLLIIEKMAEDVGLEVKSFTDPVAALDHIKKNHPDMIFADYMMPGMDGVQLITEIRAVHPDVPVIMITSYNEEGGIKLKALRAGATEFLNKPLEPSEFTARIVNLSTLRKSQLLLKDRALLLEEEVRKAVSNIRVREMEALETLGRASDYRDEVTGNHVRRVAEYSRILGTLSGMNETDAELVFLASTLHDVGKIGISDSILLKDGPLTDEEFAIIKTHAEIGHGILKEATSPYLSAGAVIALTHHEKFDGSGYPHGLSGSDIPVMGRITALADALDALTTRRPYHSPISFDDAVKVIRKESGNHFDPDLVRLFLDNIEKFKEVFGRFDSERRNQREV